MIEEAPLSQELPDTIDRHGKQRVAQIRDLLALHADVRVTDLLVRIARIACVSSCAGDLLWRGVPVDPVALSGDQIGAFVPKLQRTPPHVV
ncbi:hypothetical protein [Micromonospora sp. S-DT3-3-22]|uniref:hypothetical protein n=1 Tax=Micromonospora sp. S-DT3-3-22 TaxID=2755359 RepID=UPI001E5FFE56|nr:hypothetical protein [Micromonospora sp. S-DT3-3-22]